MEQEFLLQHPGIELKCVIGDVKNAARVAEALSAHRPQIVFHAAAYRHVPLMEEGNAWEAIQNNVLGTWRVAAAAIAHGVTTFFRAAIAAPGYRAVPTQAWHRRQLG